MGLQNYPMSLISSVNHIQNQLKAVERLKVCRPRERLVLHCKPVLLIHQE